MLNNNLLASPASAGGNPMAIDFNATRLQDYKQMCPMNATE